MNKSTILKTLLCLVAKLHAQFADSAQLEQVIKANMRGLGYDG